MLDPDALKYAAPARKRDRDYVMKVVKQKGEMLEYAAEKLKADRDVVLAAVTQNWRALKHATEDLKADLEVVLAAVKQNSEAFKDVADELKVNRDVVCEVAKTFMRTTVEQSMAVTEDHHRKTVTVMDIVNALKLHHGVHYFKTPAWR
eukprot:COSAG05_NODE_1613_length_4406_cov_23.155561_1_plen_148_part_00